MVSLNKSSKKYSVGLGFIVECLAKMESMIA